MIRNDSEYARAVERIADEQKRLDAYEQQFSSEFAPDEVRTLMEPLRSFHAQLTDEIRVYERLKRGDLGDMTNLHGIGRLLIHLRIARGLTQRELAEILGVHESQVSRDERNEYHGVALERASRILDAIGVKVHSTLVEPVASPGLPAEATWPPARRERTSYAADSRPPRQPLTPALKVTYADDARAA